MLQDLLRGKLFGHPIHVMLVHFPAALLPLAATLDGLRLLAHVEFNLDTAVMLWPGVALGWLAACFGLWDLVRLKTASKEMSVGLVHGGINATAVAAFTWAILIRNQDIRVWVEIVSTLLILFGNKFGGDLIFRYRVGLTPQEDHA